MFERAWSTYALGLTIQLVGTGCALRRAPHPLAMRCEGHALCGGAAPVVTPDSATTPEPPQARELAPASADDAGAVVEPLDAALGSPLPDAKAPFPDASVDAATTDPVYRPYRATADCPSPLQCAVVPTPQQSVIGYCTPACQTAASCPAPSSGSVTVSCFAGSCSLGSCQQAACPNAMHCTQGIALLFATPVPTYTCSYTSAP